MAQWDARDPRWLVENRVDGQNINGWHWTERSILREVRERVAELFSNQAIDLQGLPGSFRIKECRSTTGDAFTTMRKGNKRLVVYDLKITLVWEGQLAGSEEKITGTVKVEEYASASDEDDYIFEVAVDGAAADTKEKARHLVSAHSKPHILRTLQALVKEMEEGRFDGGRLTPGQASDLEGKGGESSA